MPNQTEEVRVKIDWEAALAPIADNIPARAIDSELPAELADLLRLAYAGEGFPEPGETPAVRRSPPKGMVT